MDGADDRDSRRSVGRGGRGGERLACEPRRLPRLSPRLPRSRPPRARPASVLRGDCARRRPVRLGVCRAGRRAGAGDSRGLPPGSFPWSARRKLRALPSFLRVLAAAPRSFRTFLAYGANAERAHPREPHWYLVVLGVRPQAQRQGLGTRLIEPVLERADRDGVACYLESSDHANVAYYQRFGFVLLDDALALVPNGPTHVAMRRPANANRAD